MLRLIKILIIWLIWVPFLGAGAGEIPDGFSSMADAPSSSVTVDLGGGLNTREFFVDLNLGLRSKSRLMGGIGISSFQSAVGTTRTSSYLVGLSSDPLETWVYGASYQYRGRNETVVKGLNGSLHSDMMQGSVQWLPGNWSFSVMPELRYFIIELKSDPVGDVPLRAWVPLQAWVYSPGVGFSVAYFGPGNFTFSLRRFIYGYRYFSNEGLYRDFLSREGIRNLLWVVNYYRQGLAGEFDKSRTVLALDYEFNWGMLGVEWSVSVSEIDNSSYRTTTMYALWDLSQHWSVTARLVRLSGAPLGTGSFGNLGGSYNW